MTAEIPTGTAVTKTEFPASGWRRALACGPNGGNCVEVNRAPAGRVAVRDSKPDVRPVLTFDNTPWDAFLGAAREGRFAH